MKRGTDLAYLKHIFAAGNLIYGITDICMLHISVIPIQISRFKNMLEMS